uniref:Uncharacterized protein n=1 Tax=Romanomermis culicivorax TaxID=13658 RepID=A0A915J8L2_ROMCU
KDKFFAATDPVYIYQKKSNIICDSQARHIWCRCWTCSLASAHDLVTRSCQGSFMLAFFGGTEPIAKSLKRSARKLTFDREG